MKKFTPSKNLSKRVTDHPAVLECDYAPDNGAPDYKYDVLLKDGFVFRSGRMAGCQTGMFKTVADFYHAEPMTREAYQQGC